MSQKQNTTPATEGKKELHTKGLWWIDSASNDSELIITAGVGTTAIASLYCQPMDEETKANAELIVKAVNERQALLDSHSELLEIVKRLDYWHHLENGVFTYTDPKKDGDQLTIDLQTAINNAKNI